MDIKSIRPFSPIIYLKYVFIRQREKNVFENSLINVIYDTNMLLAVLGYRKCSDMHSRPLNSHMLRQYMSLPVRDSIQFTGRLIEFYGHRTSTLPILWFVRAVKKINPYKRCYSDKHVETVNIRLGAYGRYIRRGDNIAIR